MSSSIPEEVFIAIQCCAGDEPHVLNDPVLLDCGHNACKICVINKQKFFCCYPGCRRLNALKKEELEYKSVKSIETLIESYLKELYEANVDEYDDVLQSIEDEGRSSLIDKQCDEIRRRILERAESLKEQIDTYVKKLDEKLELKKNKLKRIIRIDIEQLVPYDDLMCPLTMEMFYESQNKLMELKQIIGEFSKDDGNPYFVTSDLQFEESVIGKLYLASCDSVFLKHKLLTSPNPFSQVEFTAEPFGICVLENSYLCVTFPSLAKICLFSYEFDLVASIDKILDATLNCPRGITTDNCDKIIVCDSLCHRLLITDYQFSELKLLGKFGTGQVEFYSPFDVLCHKEYVYVCDTGNKRVQKLTDNFAHLRSYPLNYHPMQIRIMGELIIIRDDKNYLHFHDLHSFKHLKTTTTQGAFGTIGKRIYQIDSDYFHFYDSKANFHSKNKLNTELKLNNANACMFKKHLVFTGQSGLYVVKNVI